VAEQLPPPKPGAVQPALRGAGVTQRPVGGTPGLPVPPLSEAGVAIAAVPGGPEAIPTGGEALPSVATLQRANTSVADRTVPEDLENIVRTAIVTTPAGTAEASPQTTTLAVVNLRLLALEVTIPNGHAGLTGFAVEYGGTRIIPFGVQEWLVGNSEAFAFTVGFDIGRTGLQVVTYNTGLFDHGHYLRLILTVIRPRGRGALVSVPTFPSDGGGGLPDGELPEEGFPGLEPWEVEVLRAAGYDPEDAMPILEQILANTEAILAQMGLAPPAEEPTEELPELVLVPSVVGLTLSVATTQLSTVGLGVEVTYQESTAAEDTVLEQDPPAGTEVDEGGVVLLTVAQLPAAQPTPRDRITVPDVVGIQVDKARSRLQARGFKVATNRVRSQEKVGKVLAQNPNAGVQRPRGETVTLRVSRGR